MPPGLVGKVSDGLSGRSFDCIKLCCMSPGPQGAQGSHIHWALVSTTDILQDSRPSGWGLRSNLVTEGRAGAGQTVCH